jgi:phosphopantothenate-cysteine ligase/phosphopantothenoylcysteine decarboxylase/phosphopantothenate--cysteine ligase
MNILVTAGNTLVPIDKVRCITNIFSGRTGAAIALHAHERGHDVQLLTSHPEVVETLSGAESAFASMRWSLARYTTFADLEKLLAKEAQEPDLDAVVHCAAVSDYRSDSVYAAAAGTEFDCTRGTWSSMAGTPTLVDRAAGKVKSDEEVLWLRLVRTPKLIDLFRGDWKFKGVLVKFKLEVGSTDAELLDIAEKSRVYSGADFMVANTLEGASFWAYLGPTSAGYQRIDRRHLPERLLDLVESAYRERQHG